MKLPTTLLTAGVAVFTSSYYSLQFQMTAAIASASLLSYYVGKWLFSQLSPTYYRYTKAFLYFHGPSYSLLQNRLTRSSSIPADTLKLTAQLLCSSDNRLISFYGMHQNPYFLPLIKQVFYQRVILNPRQFYLVLEGDAEGYHRRASSDESLALYDLARLFNLPIYYDVYTASSKNVIREALLQFNSKDILIYLVIKNCINTGSYAHIAKVLSLLNIYSQKFDIAVNQNHKMQMFTEIQTHYEELKQYLSMPYIFNANVQTKYCTRFFELKYKLNTIANQLTARKVQQLKLQHADKTMIVYSGLAHVPALGISKKQLPVNVQCFIDADQPEIRRLFR